jgi:hypothetical protein
MTSHKLPIWPGIFIGVFFSTLATPLEKEKNDFAKKNSFSANVVLRW